MQVQLRQPEIVEALRQYIANKGISLSGSTFQVHFTAGRKETGISAEITMENEEIPGVELAPVDVPKPSLSVVQSPTVEQESLPEVLVDTAKTGTTSLFS